MIVNRTKQLLNDIQRCSNHEFLLEQLKNYQGCEKPHTETVVWSCNVEEHAQKSVERCCELANKQTKQLYKVSSLFLDDLHLKKEELESVGELSKVCSQIVSKCLYLSRICRPDIL